MATYTDNYNLTKPTMNELADIRVINGNMDTVDTVMHGAQVSIADAYDPTQTYAVGDYAINQFLLYRCITAVTTPEAFDVNKWTRVTAIGEIPTDTFTGATSQTAGSKGLVPAPSAGDQNKYLKANGTWDTPAGGGGGGIDYSTTEQNTGLKWIDGKDIYQITLEFTHTSSGEQVVINKSLYNMDVVMLYDIYAYQTSGDRYEFISTYYSGSNDKHRMFIKPNGDIVHDTGSSFVQGKIYATLRYTKTTVATV